MNYIKEFVSQTNVITTVSMRAILSTSALTIQVKTRIYISVGSETLIL